MCRNQPPENTYLINDVSRLVGLSQKRIREYEKCGLIRPDRELNTNNRRYTDPDILLIQRIKTLIHEHGFTLAGIKYAFSAVPCWIIFGCSGKESCAAYATFPPVPCYTVAEKVSGPGRLGGCDKCPIFLNRDEKRLALLTRADDVPLARMSAPGIKSNID
jgi:hypothetical protein